ncbi:MAG: hypothetical protein U0637_14185 [Phycisphaerales bacterium]
MNKPALRIALACTVWTAGTVNAEMPPEVQIQARWTPTELGNQSTNWADVLRPTWLPGSDPIAHWLPGSPQTQIIISNLAAQDNVKTVYLELTYFSVTHLPSQIPLIVATSGPDITVTPNNLQPPNAQTLDNVIRYTWTMSPQPGYEFIRFPDERYYYLDTWDPNHKITKMEVGTVCVPTPAGTVALVVAGAWLMHGRRR